MNNIERLIGLADTYIKKTRQDVLTDVIQNKLKKGLYMYLSDLDDEVAALGRMMDNGTINYTTRVVKTLNRT